MDLSAFKVSISNLNDDELMALLMDIRTRRLPVTDLVTLKERAKPKARASSSGKTSVASIGATFSKDDIKRLLEGLKKGGA